MTKREKEIYDEEVIREKARRSVTRKNKLKGTIIILLIGIIFIMLVYVQSYKYRKKLLESQVKPISEDTEAQASIIDVTDDMDTFIQKPQREILCVL